MKLKDLHQDAESWATNVKTEIDNLLDSDINDLNMLALPRILSIITGLSAARCSYVLKKCKSASIYEQLKFFYDNV